MNDQKQIVRDAYDRIAERYLEWRNRQPREEELTRWVKMAHDYVKPGGNILDLGCGAGIPLTRVLSETFDVTGVDISLRQVELARSNVPKGCFIHADVATLDLPPASFDAAVASYSLFHIPRDEHIPLFRLIARWLRPGGVLLANFGIGNREVDYNENWLGVPLFWSSFNAEGQRAALRAGGFELVFESIDATIEDGRPHPFLVVVAPSATAGRGIERT